MEDNLYEHRQLEPQFVLIYGRQSEFERSGEHDDPGALRRKRDGQRARDESFMTFDSLRPRYEHRNSMTVKMTATGPEAIAFSPVYGTSTASGAVTRVVRNLAGALQMSVMMTTERRRYVSERFEHWHQREEEPRRGDRLYIRQTGFE